MIIAVDGPTASGKGTIAARLAEHFGLKRLDTGALYRAVGLAVLDAGKDPSDEGAAVETARKIDLHAIDERRIRTAAAAAAASKVAVFHDVRAALYEAQRSFAQAPGGAVLDGRDIGTVICPDAEVKIFVTAALKVRAARRHKELEGRGEAITLAEVERQIAERDARDANRADAPLRQAEDAHLLDTSELDVEGAVAAAITLVDVALAER